MGGERREENNEALSQVKVLDPQGATCCFDIIQIVNVPNSTIFITEFHSCSGLAPPVAPPAFVPEPLRCHHVFLWTAVPAPPGSVFAPLSYCLDALKTPTPRQAATEGRRKWTRRCLVLLFSACSVAVWGSRCCQHNTCDSTISLRYEQVLVALLQRFLPL